MGQRVVGGETFSPELIEELLFVDYAFAMLDEVDQEVKATWRKGTDSTVLADAKGGAVHNDVIETIGKCG